MHDESIVIARRAPLLPKATSESGEHHDDRLRTSWAMSPERRRGEKNTRRRLTDPRRLRQTMYSKEVIQ